MAELETSKRDRQEIIAYLREPKRYRAIGAKVPRGLLLMGPPGTGEALLAKAAAGEADVPFYSISASEFIEIFVGVGVSRVRHLFEDTKKEASAIISSTSSMRWGVPGAPGSVAATTNANRP